MKYTKKPITIDAWLISSIIEAAKSNWNCLPYEIKEAYEKGDIVFSDNFVTIKTLEGNHKGCISDMIIRGVNGEFYPCKPDIFNKTYTPFNGDVITFGDAIEALKLGKKVTRKGWNGKGMYLWLMPESEVKAEWCKEPHLKSLAEDNGGSIQCLGTIRMFTTNSSGRKAILTGWLASQSDMLSEDWVILE